MPKCGRMLQAQAVRDLGAARPRSVHSCSWTARAVTATCVLWLLGPASAGQLIHSLIHSFTHLLTYSFNYSFTHSFTHSLLHSFIHSLTHLHSLSHAFAYSFSVGSQILCLHRASVSPGWGSCALGSRSPSMSGQPPSLSVWGCP